MQYCCDICKATITEGEYKYSNDVFGKTLCRKHQDIERASSQEIPQKTTIETNKEIPPSQKLGRLLKKVAVTTGKTIKKSATTVTDTTRKSIQKRRWKDKILMRLEPKLIKQLAHENRINLELVDKPTNNDYINAIKNDVSLDNIIAFAKRNYVNIRDILAEIEELKIKEDNREIKNDGNAIKDFYEQLVEAIKLFQPSGSYENESPYHMQLLGYLKGKFPNAKIGSEEYRLSSRPDITIDGIAIEVKGPTGDRELGKIADKCLRYLPSHPKGMIIVLFNISASQYRYEEWLKNMNKQYPKVKIIPK